MSTLTIFKAVIELLILAAICIGFYHEDKVAEFERKVFKFIKCFVKACIITAEQKFSKKSSRADICVMSPKTKMHNKDNRKRIA